MVFNLAGEEIDCFLSFSESYNDSNQYYLTKFLNSDPFLYFKIAERECIVVPNMEVERAKEDSDIEVIPLNKFDKDKNRYLGAIKQLLSKYNCKKIGVPKEFPFYLADKLDNYKLEPLDIARLRAIKDKREIQLISEVQKSAEKALKKAVSILNRSKIKENTLFLEDKPLTSHYIRNQINIELLRNDCISRETIVSSGRETSSPHHPGSGPMAPDPIIIDIFPKNRETRYCGDITRSFSKQKNKKTKRIYNDVLDAQRTALEEIKPGKTGAEIHNSVCKYLENLGYNTPRTEGNTGFIHSTGHGLGLDLHEHPRLAKGGEELKEGHVVTVEPGIYNPEFGGIRIEDLIVIEENSYRNLTEFEKTLYLS